MVLTMTIQKQLLSAESRIGTESDPYRWTERYPERKNR